MPTNKLTIPGFILFISFAQLLCAKTNNNNSELTVEADESLEWFEKEKYYLAKGNVILKKGTFFSEHPLSLAIASCLSLS